MGLGQRLIQYIIDEEEPSGIDPLIADQLYIGEGGHAGPDWFIDTCEDDLTYAVLRRARLIFYFLRDILRENYEDQIGSEFIDVVVEPSYEGPTSVVVFMPKFKAVLGFWDMKMDKIWFKDVPALSEALVPLYEELETNLKKVLASK